MIQLLHTGNLRLEKGLNRAKQSMYLAWVIWRIEGSSQQLYNMLKIQLTKAHMSI